MKTFKSIQDFLASKPSKEMVSKILVVINKGAIVEMRREFYKKSSEFRKVERTINSMKTLGIPISTEVNARVNSLKTEIEEIKKQLPEKKVKQPKK